MVREHEDKIFAFAIKVISDEEGNKKYQSIALNNDIPTETIIMQMKAYLKNLEDQYYDDFEAGTPNST
ncbi:hypothetical protein HYY69_05755 [Candidatus Woesearchaeota archaeon]|nr:hypothetical protein [Candidatus Woesearchaeota archaeon]